MNTIDLLEFTYTLMPKLQGERERELTVRKTPEYTLMCFSVLFKGGTPNIRSERVLFREELAKNKNDYVKFNVHMLVVWARRQYEDWRESQ